MITDESKVVARLRQILLAILLLGLMGSGAELLLTGHTEDWRQWIPLLLIGACLLTLLWFQFGCRAASLVWFRWLMAAFVLAGFAGIYFHYLGSAEFKLESNPSLSGLSLLWEAIRSKTPPALAPGVMIQLGLIGLAYAYKHPLLTHQTKTDT